MMAVLSLEASQWFAMLRKAAMAAPGIGLGAWVIVVEILDT